MLTSSAQGSGTRTLLLSVFLPFAAGYHISYLFRTIHAMLSDRLTGELQLTAAELGALTSAYFLAAALAQLPLGMALDRFGPRRVQTAMLIVAAAGAALFAVATSFPVLCVSRALIGLGVASALMAGLKAIVLWHPKERVPMLNGIFVALGAAGALTAAAPLNLALTVVEWRELFIVLAFATLGVAAATLCFAPEQRPEAITEQSRTSGLVDVYYDWNFWRLAPLSALLIGTAWAYQGLWAAPWLRTVAGYDQEQIVFHLNAMACALCAGALGFGFLADRLRKFGITTRQILAATALLFIFAELSLAFDLPLPSIVLWPVIASVGAATVLSYSLMAELFGKEVIGRANSALNLFHFGAAFAVQSSFGAIIGLWGRNVEGAYPPVAFDSAILSLVVLQIAALIWFLLPARERRAVPKTAA